MMKVQAPESALPPQPCLNGDASERGISDTTSEAPSQVSDETDEVLEVRNVARRDTQKVVALRYAVTGALLLTAIAVTLTTYFFLDRQQVDNFEELFEQFARTVADSALEHQEKARNAYRGFANTITAISQETPGVWPNFYLPNFESYAQDVLKASNTEVLGLLSYVTHDQKDDWLTFVNRTYEEMVAEAHMIRYGNLDNLFPIGYQNDILEATLTGMVPDIDRDYYYMQMHFSPAPFTYGFINWNGYSDPVYGPLCDDLVVMKTEQVFSKVKPYSGSVGIAWSAEQHAEMHEHVHLEDSTSENPHSFMMTAIFERVNDPESPIVGVVANSLAWDFFMIGLLPEGVNGITVVLENDCEQVYTYEVNGPTVRFLGEGDFHDRSYDSMEVHQNLDEGFYSHPLYEELENHCRFSIRIYPAKAFEDSLDPNTPEIFAVVVACTFVVVALVFFLYDLFVHRRNEKLIANAAQSNAIVSSMFPRNLRDRLINTKEGPHRSLKSYMSNVGDSGDPESNKPLADLFLDCTVMFADISGFTAWSSVREPSQVFSILETVYGAFDQIAKLRRIFKVETVGDCYVAATGIPEFRKDHAVSMVRFARDILRKMSTLTKELEKTLGPDTADLSLRIGIHSGPVTAGVLRGERARFQLFGDTMNVCSRVEGTGTAGRIHVSAAAAECIKMNGKGHWLIKREEEVVAKGLGDIQTFWVGVGVVVDRREGSVAGSEVREQPDLDNLQAVFEPTGEGDTGEADYAKMSRLIDWKVEMLAQIMKQIVARRNAKEKHKSATLPFYKRRTKSNGATFIPLEEVEEIIELPEFDAKVARRQEDPESIDLPQEVIRQLRDYVSQIAGMYRQNAFHNFEHASHVTMSVIKLLSRIVAPTEVLDDDTCDSMDLMDEEMHHTLHDHTYGITSDPLTQFSCAFAAMIHDVDHVGVPNAQLVREKARIVEIYGDRSVAEQNSLVLAWDLLMMDDFKDLRSALCANQTELDRFRQLVVNGVMATDIVDKDLKALRNGRWDKAFKDIGATEDARAAVNRKATIVMEHLIQASDVAHTMQHWHVYRKWNENFFRECYAAYVDGRAEKDPSEGWYKGEMGFFDFYIIPLAKKLAQCGVFGKSSDEYLNYALANRKEWERRGEAVVAEMLQAIKKGEAKSG